MTLQDTYDPQFMHYGVKGQKWGVRTKGKSAPTTRKKVDPATLSNAQLSKMVRQMSVQKSYSEVANSPKRSEGKEYAHSLLKSVGTTIATAAIGAAVSFAVNKALKTKFDVPVKTLPPPLPV